MEFGSEFHRGKEPCDTGVIVKERNGALRLELPRDHPRVINHSRYQLQSWRANGDVSLIISNSDPDTPSANDIIAVTMCVVMHVRTTSQQVQPLTCLRIW